MYHQTPPDDKSFNYTANKIVFLIVSKKQQENIILFAVMMG